MTLQSMNNCGDVLLGIRSPSPVAPEDLQKQHNTWQQQASVLSPTSAPPQQRAAQAAGRSPAKRRVAGGAPGSSQHTKQQRRQAAPQHSAATQHTSSSGDVLVGVVPCDSKLCYSDLGQQGAPQPCLRPPFSLF
jgi:hypothetical protein